MKKKKLKALNITYETLVGGPRNCFGVKANNGQDYKIVNFYVEKIRSLRLKWPVDIEEICPGVAIIKDKRIAKKHYNDHYCEVCCPREHLLQHQKDRIDQEIKDGTREEKVVMQPDGSAMRITTIHIKAKERKLKTKFVMAPFVEVFYNADSEKELTEMMAKMIKEGKYEGKKIP